LSSLRRWFRLPLFYKPRAERRESPALAAVHWDGTNPKQNDVANISESGAFVLTQEAWQPGEIVSLTLQRSGAVADAGKAGFTLQARTVRRDSEGVGVAFVLPENADLRLWQSVIKASVPQTEPEDVVREFRIASAISLVDRIAPEATQKANVLLRHQLSSHRLESALEIALHAGEIIKLEPADAKFSAHPDLVLRVLEDGSWTEEEWLQHFWAGLLASCSLQQNPVEHDLHLASLLAHITPIQVRIFAASCDRAQKFVDSQGRLSAQPLICKAEEIIQIAGIYDRVHIERDLQRLMELELIGKSVKWKSFAVIEEADITPTNQALELYAYCHGHRGDAAQFYSVAPAETSTFAAD
jgi:hypothetical protein